MNKIILLLSILIFTSNVNAFDYKRCMDVNIEKTDIDGMKEIISQVMQLEEVGRVEDVNFLALGYLYSTVAAYSTGFDTARVILMAAKFTNKESEINSRDVFKILSNYFVKALEGYSDSINKNIVFVKNQSIRDDLKVINRKNALLLKKLAPCSN